MKKYYNILFPIWFIILFPPVVLILIPGNFIIDSLVLLLGMYILKLSNKKEVYNKYIIKIVIIGFFSDIIGSLLLLLTTTIQSDKFYDIMNAIAQDPFSNIFAFIIILIAIFISALLIYILNKKYCFKELDLKKRNFLALLIAIITAPYLFLIPSKWLYQNNNYYNVENDKGITLIDSRIENVIYYTPIAGYLKDYKIEGDTLILNIDNSEEYVYIPYYQLEESSALIFNIVRDVKMVLINMNEKNYVFSFDYINKIYKDVYSYKNINILNRYKDNNFQDYEYFGHVNGYDIFDFSTSCTGIKQDLYEDNEYKYKVECSSVDELYLVNGSKVKIKDALNNKLIAIEELNDTNLKLSKELK